MRLALYQPDIPQNVGGAIRAAACFGAGVDIIGPCGFPLASRDVRRVMMDYGLLAVPEEHSSWRAFEKELTGRSGRLVLLSTKSARSVWEFAFEDSDTLMVGRESGGAPEEVHARADAHLVIPMRRGARSLNVVAAASVALAEARRQIGWPNDEMATTTSPPAPAG